VAGQVRCAVQVVNSCRAHDRSDARCRWRPRRAGSAPSDVFSVATRFTMEVSSGRRQACTFDQIPRPAESIDPLSVPILNDGVRQRLTARFGADIGSWSDELPDVLGALAQRWQLQWGSLIPRGSMSVVIRCAMPDGRPAVLKVSPDRARLANEAAALDRWTTVHTPSVLAVDQGVGALLIEAIEPGTPLIESLNYPDTETTADLLTSLHANGVPDPSYPPLSHHVAYLFNSGTRPYQRHPELLELIPPEL
jgi:hypothetical protein